MRLRILLVALLVLCGAAGGWFLHRSETPADPPTETQAFPPPSEKTEPVSAVASIRETAPLGAVQVPPLRFRLDGKGPLRYRIDLTAQAAMDLDQLLSGGGRLTSGGENRQTVRTSGEGELYLRFYPAEPGTWDAAGLLTAVGYRIGDETPWWVPALEYPFTFRMDSRGIMNDFRFTKGIPLAAREITRDVLLSMQVILPEAGKSSWETREVDTTGRYRAVYTLKEADGKRIALQKRKTEYLATRSAPDSAHPQLSASRPRLEDAEASILISREGPWLERVAYEEASSTWADGRPWSVGERRFMAQRKVFEGQVDFPESIAEFRKRLNSEQYLETRAYRTDPDLDRIGSGMSMEEAVGFYLRLIASEAEEERRVADAFLVNYLRQHPMASFDLVYLLDISTAEEIDDAVQLRLWSLLTEAGHREAQQALTQAASGQMYSELTQWRAVSYAHDFARPESELVDELWRLYSQPGASDPQLQEMALYALGSLGGKENIAAELGERLHHQLTAELAGSTTVGERALALAAIGNTGSPAMIDTVAPYMSSPDAEVRSAACDAMRRMQDPAAADLLIRQYQGESSAPVREIAAETLARLPASADSARWARQEVLRTQESETQIAMVRILGDSLERFPQNESALRELLEQNPARKVKKEVYRYIAPQ